MARCRMIRPELFRSAQINRLSIPARYLFIGLLTCDDDSGVYPADPFQLRINLLAADSFSQEEVRALVDEMIREGLVAEYMVDGQKYWRTTGFAKHQRIDKPFYRYPLEDGSVPASTSRRAVVDQLSTRRRPVHTPARTVANGRRRDVGNSPDGRRTVAAKEDKKKATAREEKKKRTHTEEAPGVCADVALSSGEEASDARLPQPPPEVGEFLAAWNEMAERSGLARSLDSPERTALIERRLDEPGFADIWRPALAKLAASRFCCGAGKGGWRASIDWFLEANNAIRLYEGQYDHSPAPIDQKQAMLEAEQAKRDQEHEATTSKAQAEAIDWTRRSKVFADTLAAMSPRQRKQLEEEFRRATGWPESVAILRSGLMDFWEQQQQKE